MELYESDKTRSQDFGAVAELYDRIRPAFPTDLITDLLSAAPVEILDVGCGTGLASRMFVGGNRRVLGVEPDPRMAAIARSHGLEVEVAQFEHWDSAARQFDLLVSGRAWHWVAPVAGALKAADVLRPGGRFAAFWNELQHTEPIWAILSTVYHRHAPDLLTSSFLLGADVINLDLAAKALAAGPFTFGPEGPRRRFDWVAEYSPQEWAELCLTYTDHRTLDGEILDALLSDLVGSLEAAGPCFTVLYKTHLLTANRS